ncbi:MAG: AbrB/MazE/SpoVT family DNA-binding domain-containing protein [bacterium]|nr:AbrB/MazE/SpoVT family DNA-binding domain-containing protein [bacterium]
MTQKVLRVGTSAAVTIPKESLKELGLKVGDRVSVEIDRNRKRVSITPAEDRAGIDPKIVKLTMNFISKYRKDLKALADK